MPCHEPSPGLVIGRAPGPRSNVGAAAISAGIPVPGRTVRTGRTLPGVSCTMAVTARVVALALGFLVSACAGNRVDAESFDPCSGTRQYYVVNHGWHAGLVLNATDLAAQVPVLSRDFASASFLEVGWGEAAFYQSPEPGIGLALKAALWPSASVLHVASFRGSRQPGTNLLEIRTDQTGYQGLLDMVASSFERENAAQSIGPGLYGSGRFYLATGDFHLFNTCNTWVAKAIRASGAPLPGPTPFTAGSLMRRLQPLAANTCEGQ